MAAIVASKWFRGRLLMGNLSNNILGSLGTPHDITRLDCTGFFSQQLRTFIQMRTKLKVVDNSGAKWVRCIQALKGRKGARLGDTIIASVQEAQPRVGKCCKQEQKNLMKAGKAPNGSLAQWRRKDVLHHPDSVQESFCLD
ncbi:hypothetical protein HPP92_005724 [Vanilla planifolia]|uniref:Ribosomal protein L14 n=1 Tax=Vanilla planifolia TaxID=51239 RepID=A0A835RUK6_VANPL|nr:hypothetical protein HPP92_005724 [Vanilla planifolia]